MGPRRPTWFGGAVSLVDSFFFSSRRRHTRFDCDWSSDVCSSDLLDQVTKALPPYTWLDGISAQGVGVGGQPAQANLPPGTADTTGAPTVRVWITGRTVAIQAYTTFLRQLAASPWLTDVPPAPSPTAIAPDRPVTAFNVSLRYKVADSVYIRTVPLTQSVR